MIFHWAAAARSAPARPAGSLGHETHLARGVVAGDEDETRSCERSTPTEKPLSSVSSYSTAALAGSSPRRCSLALSLRQCSLISVKTTALLSLAHTGWPMAMSPTVSMSAPVARSRMRSLNAPSCRRRPKSPTCCGRAKRRSLPAGNIRARRPRRPRRTPALLAAAQSPAEPLAVLRARLEGPPISRARRPAGRWRGPP